MRSGSWFGLLFLASGLAGLGCAGEDEISEADGKAEGALEGDAVASPVALGHYTNDYSNAALLVTREGGTLRASLKWNGLVESTVRAIGPVLAFDESAGCTTKLVQMADAVEAQTICPGAPPKFVQMKRDRGAMVGRYVAPLGSTPVTIHVTSSDTTGVEVNVVGANGRAASGAGVWTGAATATVELPGCGKVRVGLVERGLASAAYLGRAPGAGCPTVAE